MAQSTILAAAQTVATSSTVAVGPGGSVGLGLFVASGDIPADVSAIVQVTTPGAVVNIGSLNKQNPYMVVPGPCTVQVRRQEAGGASVGVYAESSVGQPVEGNIANNVAESGNPVLIGARYDATPSTRTTGNRSALQTGSFGSLRVSLFQNDGNNGVRYQTTGQDGDTNTIAALVVQSDSMVFNGTTWDRARGDAVAQSALPGLSSTFWTYAPPTAGISSSTAGVTAKTAAGASVRNYIAGGMLSWNTLSAATEFVIRDGASGTVLWRATIGTVAGIIPLNFNVPLRGTANTLVEIAAISSVTGNIHCTLQGFTGA